MGLLLRSTARLTRDAGEMSKASMDLLNLEKLLNEIDWQPQWRPEADRAADYYDGKQLDMRVVGELSSRNQPLLVYNLIAPAIDGVLGIEAKTRVDWMVRADDDDGLDVALGLNERLNEASRLSLANRACSDAHGAQVKTGLGWVEVNRNPDPFGPPYRVQYIHRREIYWDWHAQQHDLSDARYLVRRKWLDVDRAEMAFPQHKELIHWAAKGWNGWSTAFETLGGDYATLVHAYSEMQGSSLNEETWWWDTERERVAVYEVWYRVPTQAVVLRSPDGAVFKYDRANPVHQAAVVGGHLKPEKAAFDVMRLAYFLGPHRVADVASPLPHNQFPYVPFWGFREDRSGIPYGLIRRMMSPQDEVNARRIKMMWLLSAKRVVMDEDATVEPLDKVLEEVQRPDGVILLNKNRKNRDAHSFNVEQDFALAAQQFEVLRDSVEMIRQTAGVYGSLLGDVSDAAQSGVAIASLVEQSSTTLAELLDNFRFAKQQVGEQLLALIVQDIGDRETLVVVDANKPTPTKRIALNARVLDEHGRQTISNQVQRTNAKVVLEDVQSTSGYRAQISNRLFELAQTLPDDLKVAVMDVLVETIDGLPQREELIKRIRAITGMGVDPESMTPEQLAEVEDKKAREKQLADLETAELEAKIQDLRARAARSQAAAEKDMAAADGQAHENRLTDAQTEQILAEMATLTQRLQDYAGRVSPQVDEEAAAVGRFEQAMPALQEMSALLSGPPGAAEPGAQAPPATPMAAPNPMGAMGMPQGDEPEPS